MNPKNLEFLKDGLKYMGFGEKLNADLEAKINQQPTEFNLSLQGEFKKDGVTDKVDYRLDFKKSDQTDMYFFNRYQATLKNEDPTQEKSQTFYITKNSGITAKEAFNLLSGRSVNKDLTNKEGQAYNAWLQLDFSEKDKNDNYKVKQYHSGYGYELDAVVSRYPIKELSNDEEKVKLMKSLEKGNQTQVTFLKDGKEEKMFIEANPQFKTLNLYDAKMQKQFQGIEKKETSEPEKSKEKKETQKQDVDEESEGKEKKSKKGKGVGV
ncbi:MAG: hypothetical protein OJF59_001813 [Cytophagales bacterium]|jgi:hypothetical protein|nr:hypothetical protein [Bacteroidota bacterium]MBS1950717.1 hypothetical protein [Bacteroidota bacterium]MBS1980723.1 hypothetical protein [Bacteroidota bacterium]WHZ08060.1 MAG: hypothetical protein OJF59_001813 [Cytophagales bacterium]